MPNDIQNKRIQQPPPKPPKPPEVKKPNAQTHQAAAKLSQAAGKQTNELQRTKSNFETPAAKAPAATTPKGEAYTPNGIGGGRPNVNYNGTNQTHIEGSAGNSAISIHNKPGGKDFDPMKQPGVALTSQQAKELGVKVGDKVTVHDHATGKDHTATYYDGAGSNRNNPLQHLEMSPKLAEDAGLNIKNKAGKYIDAVEGSNSMRGRFEIRPYKP